MKFQINKGSNLCDDFVNMLRLPVEADGSEERGRMQRQEILKLDSKRNLI